MNNKDLKLGLGVAGAFLGFVAAGTWLYYKKRPTIPAGVEAVKPFQLKRYLGKWYEICRMPMRYENGLTQVTAEYSWNSDGSIRVVNEGFDERRNRWRRSVGRAVPVGDRTEGKLKVSFFGPFYAGYNVAAIDEDYKYALVFGRSLDYMWILSREKEPPEHILKEYLQKAVAAGYDFYRLVWTEQEAF